MSNDLKTLSLTLNSTTAAASNTTRLQALLNAGGALKLLGDGVCYVNDTLVLKNNTRLELDHNLTLRLAPSSNVSLLINEHWNSTVYSVSSITPAADVSSHRYIVTVSCTGHPFAVGDYALLKGDTSGQYVGVFEVATVPDANSFTVVMTSYVAMTNGTGTLTAAQANANITLSGGTLDQNGANNGGTGNQLMMVILNKVGNVLIENQRAVGAHKYAYYPCNAYGFTARHLKSISMSAAIQFLGPVRNVKLSDISGSGGDDFIAYAATNGGGYTAYDLPDCNGEVIDMEIDGVLATAGNNIVAIYPGAGYACSGVRISNLTGGSPKLQTFVTIATVAATTASLPDDIEIDGLYGDCAVDNYMVTVGNGNDAGAIQSLKIRNLQPGLGRRNNMVFAYGGWTINRLSIKDFRAKADLTTRAVNVFYTGNPAAVVNYLEFAHGSLECSNFTSFGSRLAMGSSLPEISVHDVVLSGAGCYGLWDAAAENVTPAIWAKQLRLDSISALMQSAKPWKLRADGISSHGSFGLLNCFQSGKAYDVRVRNLDIQSNPLFSSTVGNVTLSGDDTARADVTAVQRVSGCSFYNTNAAAGTLGAAGMVVCQGTASGSWHLMADPTLVY